MRYQYSVAPRNHLPKKKKKKTQRLKSPCTPKKKKAKTYIYLIHMLMWLLSNKDPLPHYSNYKIKRPTTPLYKPITKQTTIIFIQTYTLA